MNSLLWYCKYVLAFFRLSDRAVCEMSAGRPVWADFHDYPDDVFGQPYHFLTLRCKRCGKEFTI